jgi:hypothetical protein
VLSLRHAPPGRWFARPAIRSGAAALLIAPTLAYAQPQHSVVSGRVLDPQGGPVALAEVVLRDPLGQRIRATVAGADGRFRLREVPPGVYHLRAEAAALRSASHRLPVADGMPVTIDLVLSPRLDEAITVGPGRPAAAAARPPGALGARRAPQRDGRPLRVQLREPVQRDPFRRGALTEGRFPAVRPLAA